MSEWNPSWMAAMSASGPMDVDTSEALAGLDADAMGLSARMRMMGLWRERAQLQAELIRLQAELEDWKRGSQVEAEAGDTARAGLARLRTVVEAMRRVVEAAHLVLDHEMTVSTYNAIRVALAELDKASQ